MKNKLFAIILSLLICVTALVGPLSPLDVDACYYTSVNSISDPQKRNAFKIWSVAKCAGMSDEEAAGILGNATVESSIDGTVLEGRYDDPYTFNVQWKQTAAADLCFYTRNTTFPAWKSQGYTINSSVDRYGHKVQYVAGDEHHSSINTSAYIGTDGHYLPGIGVFQFTGPGASKLINFANSISKNWWDIDTQLIYTFKLDGENTYGKAQWLLNSYSIHTYNTPENCAYYFFWVFEAGHSDTTFDVTSDAGGSSCNRDDTCVYRNERLAKVFYLLKAFLIQFHGISQLTGSVQKFRIEFHGFHLVVSRQKIRTVCKRAVVCEKKLVVVS